MFVIESGFDVVGAFEGRDCFFKTLPVNKEEVYQNMRTMLGDRVVIDRARQAWLICTGLLIPDWGDGFILAVGDDIIAFEYDRHEEIDPATGKPYYLGRFTSFGSSSKIRHMYKIEDFVFASDMQRRAYQRLAVEALLVFGSNYNGDQKPEGYDVAELNGERFTKRSFGYA